MKKKPALIGFLLLFTQLLLHAQSIQMTILPATEYNLARRDEWKVIVNNTTNQKLNAYFYGIATEAQRGKVYEVYSQARDIFPGLTNFSTQYYVGLEPFNKIYEDQTLRQYAVQTNGLPAGDYEICITAFSSVDSTELGNTCYSFSEDHFTPPVLISPENDDTVREDYPFFTWLPPVPNNGQNFTYSLTLYELQNMQTVLSAVQTNPAYYNHKGITVPVSQYGIDARNLRDGRRYAWKVSAEVNNQTVATSEVWSFVFAKEKAVTVADSTTKKNTVQNLPKAGIPYLETTGDVVNRVSVLDHGMLSFIYTHQTNTPAVGMRILDMKGAPVYSKKLDVNYGTNYFSAPLSDYNALKPGELYDLQIIDMNGAIKKLRFKIKP